jgi:hypothetical protein
MKLGNTAVFDSMLRLAWYSDDKYPLSAGLYASAKLKGQLNACIRVDNEMRVRKICKN